MSHDVFISHSSKDRAIADAIVANFESNGLRCWYAPRDIGPGVDWGEAITQAIDACSVMLLVFSGNANDSKHVLDEVYYALDEEKILIPFRVENLNPHGAMRLHLSSLHWLNAYDPTWEAHIDKLFETVSTNLSRELSDERVKFAPKRKIKPSSKKSSRLVRGLLSLFLATIVVVSIIVGLPWLRDLNSPPVAPTAAPTDPLPPAVEMTPTPTPPDPTATVDIDPLGSETNPLTWMYLPSSDLSFQEIDAAAVEIEIAFETWSEGLILNMIPSIDYEGIVAAICDGEAHVGDLEAFHYLDASERECADVSHVQTQGDDIKFGWMFVSRAGSGISSLSSLEERTLCVSSVENNFVWLMPSLELRAAGIDLNNSGITIVETGDHMDVLDRVYEGTCDAGVSWHDARENSDIPNVNEELVIFYTTPPVPAINYSIALGIDEETSRILRQFLSFMGSDETHLAMMEAIYSNQYNPDLRFIEINDSYYNEIRDLLDRAGVSIEEVLPFIDWF